MSQAGTVYGQGLYTLTMEEGLEGQILEELAVLETAFGENPEFLKLLASHNIPLQEAAGLPQYPLAGAAFPFGREFPGKGAYLCAEFSQIADGEESYPQLPGMLQSLPGAV